MRWSMVRLFLVLFLLGLVSAPARAATLTGVLFEDQNANGARDPGEPCVSGFVELRAVGSGLRADRLVQCGTGQESYAFRDLAEGSYQLAVTETLPPEYDLPPEWEAALPSDNRVIQHDFALQRKVDPNGAIYSIEGAVRHDTLRPPPNRYEPLADAVVLVYDDSGSLIRITPTDRDGTYRFEKLPPGRYRVVAANPYGQKAGTTSPESPPTSSIEVDVAPPTLAYHVPDFVKLDVFKRLEQFERLLGEGDPVAALFQSDSEDPRPIGGLIDAIRRITDDGSLIVLDPAGTALMRVGNSRREVLVGTSVTSAADDIILSRILRVETNWHGVSALVAARTAPGISQALYRLESDRRLTRLAVFPRPVDLSQLELAIDGTGQTAFTAPLPAPLDGRDPEPFALYQAGSGQPPELLLQTGAPDAVSRRVRGLPDLTIVGIRDLTGNEAGELALLVALRGADGRPVQAVVQKTRAGLRVVAASGWVVAKGRGQSEKRELIELRRPRIGPEGSVVFQGTGDGFVNFFVARPGGELTPLLEGTRWNQQPDSFDIAIADDGTVAIRAENATSSAALYRVDPLGEEREVTAGTGIEPAGRPAFGPRGLLFFLGAKTEWPLDPFGRRALGLFRSDPRDPGGTPPVEVAVPGQSPLGPPGARVQMVPHSPVVAENSVAFAAALDQGLPAGAGVGLYRIPLLGTVTDALPVASEGDELPSIPQVTLIPDFYHTGDGNLVIDSFVSRWLGGGQILYTVPPARPPLFQQQSVADNALLKQLLAKGQDLGADRRLSKALAPLLFVKPGQWLFVGQFAQKKSGGEGLFTITVTASPGSRGRQVLNAQFQTVAVAGDPVPGRDKLFFAAFAGKNSPSVFDSPAVSPDGNAVFKARLSQAGTPTTGVLQWQSGGSASLSVVALSGDRLSSGDPPPEQPDRWAAGSERSAYVLEHYRLGMGTTVGRLFQSKGSELKPAATTERTPVNGASGGVLARLSNLVAISDRVCLQGAARINQVIREGLFSLEQGRLVPLKLQEDSVPNGPKGELHPQLAFAGDFAVRPESASCGQLLFAARVRNTVKGGAQPRGLFRQTAAGVETLLIEGLEVTGARQVTYVSIPADLTCASPTAGPHVAAADASDLTLAFASRSSDGRWAVYRLWPLLDPLRGRAQIRWSF
jgi:hypothetical protein